MDMDLYVSTYLSIQKYIYTSISIYPYTIQVNIVNTGSFSLFSDPSLARATALLGCLTLASGRAHFTSPPAYRHSAP